MSKKILGALLSLALVIGFSFDMPNISRMFEQVTVTIPSVPGPHFTPGPNEPLGPFPSVEFEHPHFEPGPNEPLGPFPPELTPPHCPPGPNEHLGPHTGNNSLLRPFTRFSLPSEPVSTGCFNIG